MSSGNQFILRLTEEQIIQIVLHSKNHTSYKSTQKYFQVTADMALHLTPYQEHQLYKLDEAQQRAIMLYS